MKRIEELLWKLVAIQAICLLIAQWLVLYTPAALYIGKVYEYEGVAKPTKTETIEV
ncbi:YpfB family protein [Geobacillus stearothermophilus]|nr:YpfB family protein [Geobacillus stearothermophilus]